MRQLAAAVVPLEDEAVAGVASAVAPVLVRRDGASANTQRVAVRVLFAAGSPSDVDLDLAALRAAGLDLRHAVAESARELEAALRREPWDVVLVDSFPPSLTGLDAIRIVRAADPDLPCIVISASMGEEIAVASMRAGANDYVLKEALARLGAAVDRELREAVTRREQRRMERDARFFADTQRFLADAGSIFLRMLDDVSTVREAVRLAVPQLADSAAGFLLEGGRLRMVGTAHEGDGVSLGAALADASFVRELIGRDTWTLIDGGSAERLVLREHGVHSVMIMPLRGRGQAVGALVLASAGANRRFAEQELAVLEDFAGRVALAVDNARLYAEARRGVRARDEFLAMLGHELRNPLAPIFTALYLMARKGDGTTLREQGIIDRQARHLARLVDDLLEVSRVTEGKIRLDSKPLEIAAAVARAAEIAAPLIEQHRHLLTLDVPETGLRVLADEARLSQVISNLLTNAAKYTPAGGRIHVRASRAGAEVVISVEDNGLGIPSDLMPTLFEPFVQGTRSIDRREGGLGLGLALVRSLTELHGGSVEARSEGPGRGSAFVVRLPALAPAVQDAAPAEPAPAREVGREGQPLRVLVVDDNVDAADLLVEALTEQGFVVCVALDPDAALERAATFRADAAVLDIGLPGMSGHELAKRLRAELGPGLRLIAVSGYGQEADKARSRAAGFEAHVVKPVELSVLVSALRR